ncbi:hypothetical protein SAMN02910456_00392 [Ruminococcaceae bacterium YRB3002]|nr:hypothetical protein SAMN02910456_00392 [Ruminococcaceae bacterium YRB3002]
MGKYIKAYLNEVREFVKNMSDKDRAELEEFIAEFETKISYFQHERLIHLLVTLTFALMEIFVVFAVFVLPDPVNLIFAVMTVIMLCLVIGYVFHYYLLENSVQEMYHLRDSIVEEIKKRA